MTLLEGSGLLAGRPGASAVAARARGLHGVEYDVPPVLIALAPGRVNLIGEHTDYCGGLVLPIAIDRWTAVAVSPGRDGLTRLLAADLDERAQVAIGARPSGAQVREERPRWMWYALGAMEQARRFAEARAGPPAPCFDITITSTVPSGAGLSSSAALEVALAAVLCRSMGVPASPVELAGIARAAEHEFAGVPCGIMDQLASACGEHDAAMLIDCAGEQTRAVPLWPGAGVESVVAVINTHVRRELADGTYAAQVEAGRRAAQALGVPSLREATEELLGGRAAAMDPACLRAATHVIGENARVAQFVKLLESAAPTRNASVLPSLGWLLLESHRSLRDYGVSCPELDWVVDHSLLQRGVHGARLTGAGGGGCAIALVDQAAFADFAARLGAEYLACFGRPCTIDHVRAVDGAVVLDGDAASGTA